ncbi:hypothetical protein N7523_003731 [Penicillium sp. IBT 18751x]|nr:hypothetical protein N7523_003731 [Penicillium sp. IBT 18751x]
MAYKVIIHHSGPNGRGQNRNPVTGPDDYRGLYGKMEGEERDTLMECAEQELGRKNALAIDSFQRNSCARSAPEQTT